MKNKKPLMTPSGVMLYAKRSGITSFSSLWSIKHALGTDKVGHTGTLDSFADGLLVVLSGNLTHLVPHITGFTKTYKAVVCFGKETDTLDPTGTVVKTAAAPTESQVREVLPKFTGTLLQVPPVYSAVHVDGKRASSLVRDGKEVKIEPRQIFVYRNELLDFRESSEKDFCSYAVLEIKCSKGTYIRALARDIADSLGSCAHLIALRRTQVGPFKLEDAACCDELKPFTIDLGIENEKREQSLKLENEEKDCNECKQKPVRVPDSIEKIQNIKKHFQFFTPELAASCGFEISVIKNEFVNSYHNGRPLSGNMFTRLNRGDFLSDTEYVFPDEIAVFYENKDFAGMVKKRNGRLNYGFVVPLTSYKNPFMIFSWGDITEGRFPVQWMKKGTAMTVGSFDGIHLGHQKLLENVLSEENLISGMVTFRSSIKSSDPSYSGDVSTLGQKMDFCMQSGINFAIVIDFSDDFSKMEGQKFAEVLSEFCGLKHIAEGHDFRCGFRGAFTMKELQSYTSLRGITLSDVDDVESDGRRISSSRIRDAVKKGRFLDVQKMLGRPYSIDCRAVLRESSDSFVFEGTVTQQVLPPDGNYDCVALFQQKKECSAKDMLALPVYCSIEGQNMKVLLSDKESVELIAAVNFKPVNNT